MQGIHLHSWQPTAISKLFNAFEFSWSLLSALCTSGPSRPSRKWSKNSSSTGSDIEVHKVKILNCIDGAKFKLGMIFALYGKSCWTFHWSNFVQSCSIKVIICFMLSFLGAPLRKKTQLRKVKRTLDIEERMLFHGTGHSNIQAICTFNFDWRLTGSHGDVYGKGRSFMLYHERLCYSPFVQF